MKLSAAARSSLSDKLGPDYIVLDMKSAPKRVDVLLVPPVRPQLIGSFRPVFPKTRVIITEIEDSIAVSARGERDGDRVRLAPHARELEIVAGRARRILAEVATKSGVDLPLGIGTMIELPRAASPRPQSSSPSAPTI